MLADELLSVIRSAVGSDRVSYAEPPIRLSGGYFTDNHAFRLAAAPAPWDVPLIVRLFPPSIPPGSARREAAVQDMVASQGFPAPRVVLHIEGGRLVEREFFIMERLAGDALMGGAETGQLVRSGASMLARLPRMMANIQLDLHRLDATPLMERLGETEIGISRWIDGLRDLAGRGGGEGLSNVASWLADNRPTVAGRLVICHGDLWGGNILVDDGRLSGLIDWTVATVAEPALDIGFTSMSLCLAPVQASAAVRALARTGGRWIASRYVRAYRQASDVDLAAVPYYEALRCAIELAEVVHYRQAVARGDTEGIPLPTWNVIAGRMVDYIGERTGVRPDLPSGLSL